MAKYYKLIKKPTHFQITYISINFEPRTSPTAKAILLFSQKSQNITFTCSVSKANIFQALMS